MPGLDGELLSLAKLAAGQEAFVNGDIKTAKTFAKLAQAKLKRGSPGWLRADDILSYEEPKKRR